MKQTIRIIGGTYRGKKLHFPVAESLRPTPDRVRETVFNWLMNDIYDARCLDAFAGSGALGFEAFSRGAAQVVFIEQSPQAHLNLKNIITQFDSSRLKLIQADTRLYLQQCAESFDIIFLDPPFSQDYIPQCLEAIARNKLLTQEGLVYIETPAALAVDTSEWLQIKSKQAGQIIYGLYTPRT